jgi:hypothetical protein
MDEFIAAFFIPHTNESAFPRVIEQLRNRKEQAKDIGLPAKVP